MALINCEECGSQISDKAASCPKCGAPSKLSTVEKQHQQIIVTTPNQSDSEVSFKVNTHKGAEVVYYTDNNNIRVTNTRFIVGSSTFPLQGITSIKSVMVPVSRTPAVILTSVGLIMLIGGLNNNGGAGLAAFGILVMALGIYWWAIIKDKYAVQITTSAAESKPLVSKDKNHIDNVTRALNEAIIHRG